MNKYTELKSCPFCGGDAVLDFARKSFRYVANNGTMKDVGYYYTVRCLECDCGIGIYENPTMATKAWNRRVNDDDRI